MTDIFIHVYLLFFLPLPANQSVDHSNQGFFFGGGVVGVSFSQRLDLGPQHCTMRTVTGVGLPSPPRLNTVVTQQTFPEGVNKGMNE